jgi:pyruvate formate lyase activating enzyme
VDEQYQMETGIIANIQRFSLHDGPGIRTTVFLKGCPMTCKWCHNPEMIAIGPELHKIESRCIRCGACIEVCTRENSQPIVNCKLCGACVEQCPTGSRQIMGETVSVGDLLKKVLRDRIIYDESGGGVTFSGGEPLRQPDFLLELLRTCRTEGLHTAVDTCGYATFEYIENSAPYTNLFLYDLKLMDTEKHIQWTGVSNKLILENLRKLNHIHHNIWIRIPVIPGINDKHEELNAIARFLSSLSGIRQVNLLPYHKTGSYKQKQNKNGEWFTDRESLKKEEINSLGDPFVSQGLNVIIGG